MKLIQKNFYAGVNKLYGDKELRKLPAATCDEDLLDEFAAYFNGKIRNIGADIKTEQQYKVLKHKALKQVNTKKN